MTPAGLSWRLAQEMSCWESWPVPESGWARGRPYSVYLPRAVPAHVTGRHPGGRPEARPGGHELRLLTAALSRRSLSWMLAG